MADNDFEKLEQIDRPLYGPRKLVVCGHPKNIRDRVMSLLEKADIRHVELIFATPGDEKKPLGELMEMPSKSGYETDLELPAAMIVGGIRPIIRHSTRPHIIHSCALRP